MKSMKQVSISLSLCAVIVLASGAAAAESSLASWRDTASKSRIEAFVKQVSDPTSVDFVPEEQRIAVFDNDGTLWAEKPVYFQVLFAIDQAALQLKADPSLASEAPYSYIAKGDIAGLLSGGEEALLELVLKTHTGMSSSAFRESVLDWMERAQHPTTDRDFTQMVYQPMLELLAYLRANGFSTWIVSGGGVGFMRPWTQQVYGIPPQQVVGSRMALSYDADSDSPLILRESKLEHINDKAGKPVGIQTQIGVRPILAVGNSDGDFQMLDWSTSGPGTRLGIIIHHTDADREWAYDRESSVGRLDAGLDAASDKDWLVVDMKKDWAAIFPPLP
ncbi:MAG: HAD family hydrolase [Congregibacter sp.]